MSYKTSRLSPLSTPRTFRVLFSNPWDLLRESSDAPGRSSWLIYDPELDETRCMNGDVFLGMALVLTVSASFWTGVGLVIAQLWN